MSQMPDIDGLLEADEKNVREMHKLFADYPYNADFGHIFSQNCACSLHKCMIVLVLYTNN